MILFFRPRWTSSEAIGTREANINTNGIHHGSTFLRVVETVKVQGMNIGAKLCIASASVPTPIPPTWNLASALKLVLCVVKWRRFGNSALLNSANHVTERTQISKMSVRFEVATANDPDEHRDRLIRTGRRAMDCAHYIFKLDK
jgi:hypothetical protein